jgi:hypothetical protein
MNKTEPATPPTGPVAPHHPISPAAGANMNEALAIVQKGLESIQSLQQQTARAHQTFLETQAQASRTLQEMMASTRMVVGSALGMSMPSAAAIQPPTDNAQPKAVQAPSMDMPAPASTMTAPTAAPVAVPHPVKRGEPPAVRQPAAPDSGPVETDQLHRGPIRNPDRHCFRTDRVSRGDAGPGDGHRGRPGHRFHQAGGDPVRHGRTHAPPAPGHPGHGRHTENPGTDLRLSFHRSTNRHCRRAPKSRARCEPANGNPQSVQTL